MSTMLWILACTVGGILALYITIFFAAVILYPKVKDEDDDTPHGDTTGWK